MKLILEQDESKDYHENCDYHEQDFIKMMAWIRSDAVTLKVIVEYTGGVGEGWWC